MPPYPATGIELDTSAPYFRKASNTRFAAMRSGIFRLAYHGINSSCGCKSIDGCFVVVLGHDLANR